MSFRLVIPGDPRPKGRPKFRVRSKKGPGFVQTYTDQKTQKYEAHVKACGLAVMAGRRPLEGALSARVTAYFTPPSSATKEMRAAMIDGGLRPITTADVDNIVKAVLDGLNGVAFTDDRRIVGLVAEKRYAETARVEVEIWKTKGIIERLQEKLLKTLARARKALQPRKGKDDAE